MYCRIKEMKMQRAGKMIWPFVGVISLAVAASWYLMSPVECRMEIAVSVGDGNAIEIKDLATIAVKVKSARCRRGLISRYIIKEIVMRVSRIWRGLNKMVYEKNKPSL
jgi:hypothetical protein